MKDKKDKIYYFQEKSNDILDLQDELSAEEIGIYFILKAGYFKYAGELKKENANQRCKFFGDINKFNAMISKLFDEVDGLLVNNSWLSEINGIKALSEKRKVIAESRWKAEQDKIETKKKKVELKTEVNTTKENDIYKQLASMLLLVLEDKLQRRLKISNWDEEIKKLIEKDLSVRPNPIEDVKRAIQTIADNYGKNYFPVVQSGSALRQKFTMIENFVKRNTMTQPPQPNSISSSFDEKKNFYLENRNRIHPNLNEINDILNKIDNNQSKTKIIAYKAKTAFFVSNNANANLDLDEKLEKYFDLIVVIDYKTKEKYEL